MPSLIPLPEGYDPFSDQPAPISAEEAAYHRGFFHGATGARGLTEAEQAQQAREVAASRTAGAVMPEAGRPDSGAADTLMGMVPGVNAVRHAAGGEWGDAAGSAVLSAMPFAAGRLGPAALKTAQAVYAGGAAMAPGATAGDPIDSLFPAERSVYAERLKQARANLALAKKTRDPDQRTAAVGAANAAIDKINGEISTIISNRATTEAGMARNDALANKWLTDNADAIKSLPTERTAAIHGAAPGDRAGMLAQFLEEKKRAGMTTAEKYADYLDPARYALLGLSGLVPAKLAYSRAGDLRTATTRADAAWEALKQGRTTAAKEGELLAARNNLAQKSTLSPMDAREMALGASVPYAATVFGPNAIDVGKNAGAIPVPTWLGGSGESAKPEDWEKTKRALWAMGAGAPWPIIEGALGAGGGSWAGGALRDFGSYKKGARGTLDTINPAANAIARKEADRAAGGRTQKQAEVLTAGVPQAAAGPLTAGTSSAAASKYPDWATTPALKRKYTMDQKKAAAQKNSTP